MSQTIAFFGARLREERERLGLTQGEPGVTPQAQRKYERGERSPDAEYLAHFASQGADVLYLLTGERNAGLLSAEERVVLAGFRAMDARARAGLLAMCSGYAAPAAAPSVDIGGSVGQLVQGNLTGPVTIGSIDASLKKRGQS